ncbi:MAG TPA: hypothetical protein VHS36_05435 [Candidatus Limnocylindrales bacterium]|nr:hypothetical protein [Candidatus Limnocylindrales bacterium]
MTNRESPDPAREILVRGARALAGDEALRPALERLLGAIAESLDVESAVVVVLDPPDRLRIAASIGLPEPAREGLAEAMRNPAHPIARTMREPVVAFDVLPTVPGGPALRSHLPLTITRNGADTILGVLALAHQSPIATDSRPLIQAAADLAAVVVDRAPASSSQAPSNMA